MPHTRKRFKKRSLTLSLDAESIDASSKWLVENLEEVGFDKSDRLRMRLLFEQALLNMADHYGVEQQANAHLEPHRGRYRLRLVVDGERYNPLESNSDDGQDEFSRSLFSAIDMHVHYAYSVGTNVLRLSLPQPTWNPVLKILIAILIGTLVGLLGNVFVPDAVQESVSRTILTPISDMWMRLLQAISGPVIFLTALTATFGTKRIADFGGSRMYLFIRYFSISACVAVFALLCSWPFFAQDVEITVASGSMVTSSLDQILKIIPGNLIEPFSTANTPQLLLIAIATGYVLAAVESQVGELKVIIQQLNVIGLTVAKYTCSLVPVFVGLLLCLKIWTHDTDLLGATWLPLALATAISAIAVIAILLISAARARMSPLLLAQKLKGTFLEALKRGTLDFSAIDDLAGSCKRLLGINDKYARALLPQGLFLYMPTSSVGIVVFVLFAAHTQQINVDQVWLVALTALSVILAVATPPITGANLLSFVMAFSYLGISNDALLDVMIFDIVFGVLCIAFDQTMLQIETIHQAGRMGFLDEKTLKAPMEHEGEVMGLFDKLKRTGINEYAANAAAQNIQVIDVREPREFAQGHIPGAVNVPLGSLERITEIAPDKTQPLYVHCQSGMRSSRACRQLKSMGYDDAMNIGGISAYRGPIETH